MKRVIIIGSFAAFAFALAGCGSTVKIPERVNVPVPVPSLSRDAVPKAPPFVADADLARMSDYQLPLALWRDRLQRQGYIASLEAAVMTCTGDLPLRPGGLLLVPDGKNTRTAH